MIIALSTPPPPPSPYEDLPVTGRALEADCCRAALSNEPPTDCIGMEGGGRGLPGMSVLMFVLLLLLGVEVEVLWLWLLSESSESYSLSLSLSLSLLLYGSLPSELERLVEAECAFAERSKLSGRCTRLLDPALLIRGGGPVALEIRSMGGPAWIGRLGPERFGPGSGPEAGMTADVRRCDEQAAPIILLSFPRKDKYISQTECGVAAAKPGNTGLETVRMPCKISCTTAAYHHRLSVCQLLIPYFYLSCLLQHSFKNISSLGKLSVLFFSGRRLMTRLQYSTVGVSWCVPMEWASLR